MSIIAIIFNIMLLFRDGIETVVLFSPVDGGNATFWIQSSLERTKKKNNKDSR